MAAERKFTTEFALTITSAAAAVLQLPDLDRISDETWRQIGRCHIYLICRRPKISVVPERFEFTPDRVKGVFRIQRGAEFEEVPFDIANRLGATDVEVVCEFPFTRLELRSGGQMIFRSSAALLMHFQGPMFAEHLDLEVLYVGQSFGFEGSRTAQDRLRSHETLQGIYAEALDRSPDFDIWLVLVNFDPAGFISVIDGREGSTMQASDDEDDDHVAAVLEKGIGEQQQVNITEAALIRYFDAPYNKTYRKSFPNPAHATYSECYDIEVNSVIVLLDTEETYIRLWSDHVPPQWVHQAEFPLYSPDERRAMFDLWD